MIPLVTRASARAIDHDAVQRLGVPGLVLMENAGRGATDAILSRFGAQLGHVVAVGGPGQNGGDAWVVARHLVCRGMSAEAVVVGDPARITGDAAVNLSALRALGVRVGVAPLDDLRALEAALTGADLVIDGLFGTGLDRPLDGGWAEAVRAINASRAPRASLDVPSGIDADTGQVLGIAVKSSLTTTFAAQKRGLHQHPGADYAGEVVLVSIGVPYPSSSDAWLVEPSDVARALPPRRKDAHKGTAGRVLVVAGGEGRTGAGLLSGYGALRAGAGLVTIATRADAQSALDARVVELMTLGLPSDSPRAVDAVLEAARSMDAVVLGPGLGLDAFGKTLAGELSRRLPIPAVLDADALTTLAELGPDLLRTAAGPRVLTPHPGEAGRLLGCRAAEVQRDRYESASRIASDTGQIVVLKGAGTVVATPGGELFVCGRGTPAMGVAGSGDVLAGVVATLLATLEPQVATPIATLLHALAGEAAARSDRGLFAREIADALPTALENCRTASKTRPT